MNFKFTTEGVVDMEQTFYVGMKICDYYKENRIYGK